MKKLGITQVNLMIPESKINDYKRRAKIDQAKHLVDVANGFAVTMDGVNDERLDGFNGLTARGIPSLGTLYEHLMHLTGDARKKMRTLTERRIELNQIGREVQLAAERYEKAPTMEKFDRGLDWSIAAAKYYAYAKLLAAHYDAMVEEEGLENDAER